MPGERILVVDDSLQLRDFIVNNILAPRGYSVQAARSGIEAVDMAVEDPPDLILTDLAMPDMDGLQMLAELRRRGLSIPAILMTAEGSEDIAVRALRTGVMDYFVKPFDPDDLLRAVQRVLAATRIGAVRTGVSDQRGLQVLNTLMAVGKSLTSLLDIEAVLGRVVEAAVFLSSAEEGTLMLVDPETGDLYVRASRNLQDGLQNMRLRVSDSLAGRVISTGEPLLVGGEGYQKIKTAYLVRSLLYIPLKIGGRVIGVLGVHNRASEAPLSRQAIASLTALADYAAVAINNAQLYEAAESERVRFRQVLQEIHDAVLLIDRSGCISLYNPAATLFFESAETDAIGRPLNEVVHNTDLLNLLAEGGGQGHRHGEVQQGERTFNASVSPVGGVGQIIVMQDITDLKALDRSKSEMVTMVSHDLRSPLTAILGYIELLGRIGPLTEQQEEFTRQARASVQHITALIDDLLDVGRMQAGMDRQREPVALTEIARRVVEDESQGAALKRQQLIYECADDVPPVLGSPTRLRQMFANLIGNAIKYTPEGGIIRVDVYAEEGSVLAVVSDTGIGIPPEEQPHIFDRYYRSRTVEDTHVGSGLGLSIVQGIVEAHEGRIWVDSAVGQGTTFTILLPAYRAA